MNFTFVEPRRMIAIWDGMYRLSLAWAQLLGLYILIKELFICIYIGAGEEGAVLVINPYAKQLPSLLICSKIQFFYYGNTSIISNLSMFN